MRRQSPHPSNKDVPYVIAPDNALRRKIGLKTPLSEVFTPEKISECQKMIDTAHTEFLKEMQEQIAALGEIYMKAADDATGPVQIRAAELVFTVKKRMEALGFSFGYKVARSLYDYIHSVEGYTPDVLLIVSKHIAVLNIILKEGITGDGGAVGRETLANLKVLIRKVGT